MRINDPFGDGFTLAHLTAGINLIPNFYSRVGQMGLMPNEGVDQHTLIVEEHQGILNLLQTSKRGAPGNVNKMGDTTIRNFSIPHITFTDLITPEQLQAKREFATANKPVSATSVMQKIMASMKKKVELTWEYHRMGALKGIVLDANGATLVNLYTEFGITPEVHNFAFTVSTTDIRQLCLNVWRHMEKNLFGETMTGVRCLCSSDFFDSLTGHAKVNTAYERWNDGEALRTDMRRGFRFGEIIFEEYVGQGIDKDGNVRKFIADGEAHFFPVGTDDVFRTYFGPGNFNGAVGKIGKPIYMSQERVDHDKGWSILVETNPLPMCRRPGLLVKGTSS